MTTNLLFLHIAYAAGSCTQSPDFKNIQAYLPNKTYSILYSDLNSYTLDTLNISYGSPRYTTVEKNRATCLAPNLVGRYLRWVGQSFPETTVPTNIPGIAINIKTADLGYLNKRLSEFNTYYINQPTWIVEIKKTGKVSTSGALTAGPLANLQQENGGLTTFTLSTLNIRSESVKINLIGCSLKNTVPTINLGDWYDTQFPALGSTSTEVDIPITLNCLPGTNIKATVIGTSGVINAAQGQLGLSGTNKATGIAIQLVDANEKPIPLSSEQTIRNNAAAGDYIFGWKARYIKTTDKVTPGSANGTATINILYE